jgi:hypothetical protein
MAADPENPPTCPRAFCLKVIAAMYLLAFIVLLYCLNQESKTNCNGGYIMLGAALFTIFGGLQGFFVLQPKAPKKDTANIVLRKIAKIREIDFDIIEQAKTVKIPKVLIGLTFIATALGVMYYKVHFLQPHFCPI